MFLHMKIQETEFKKAERHERFHGGRNSSCMQAFSYVCGGLNQTEGTSGYQPSRFSNMVIE